MLTQILSNVNHENVKQVRTSRNIKKELHILFLSIFRHFIQFQELNPFH